VVEGEHAGDRPRRNPQPYLADSRSSDPQRLLHHNRAMTQRVESVPELVKGLYAIVWRLEEKYPGRL